MPDQGVCMPGTIVTDVPRPDEDAVTSLQGYGVATVHEAMGRVGSLGAALRPIQQGVAIAGRAVTALCWSGDNLMIHAAVEQCSAGDVLVVATASPATHGMFGDLFATALMHRGVRGVVIDAGIRDIATLREIGFPAWSRHVSAEGTVKATAGSVNMPVVVAGQVVRAGDVIVADDDGVGETVSASQRRVDKEDAARAAFDRGQLGLDRYELRPLLKELGVEYRTWADEKGAQ
jgi:4-hydroxy-4-methyl-2-oxoglutarate aldolase